MRQTDAREEFEGFLWGEVALVALMGAALALFLTKQTLRGTWDLPQLRLMLMTLYAVGGGLVALLSASRFSAEGRRFDLLLCGGFLTGSLAWVAFSIAPDLAGLSDHRAATWAGLAGVLLGWTLVALAPFARRRVEERRKALFELLGGVALTLALLWVVAHAAGAALPDIHTAQGREPALLTATLAALALVNLIALVGFGNRFRVHGEDLDRWLALGSTLMLFAALHFVFTPPAGTTFVSQGDFLRLLAYAVLVVGVWRAIRSSDLRRAVAEERARVAREIHDGLAQYLFAVTAHISMLENGAEQDETLPRLKEAALAAQQEARFAVLALSSAAGSAPFDAALRRYVDLLTADGGPRGRARDRQRDHPRAGRADRDLPDRPGGPRERAQARGRAQCVRDDRPPRHRPARLRPRRRRRLRPRGERQRRRPGAEEHAPTRRHDRRRALACVGSGAWHCPGDCPPFLGLGHET